MKYKGNLDIRKDNVGKYSGLTEVTGFLFIHSNAKLDAPALTSVGGNLFINSDAKLDAPALTSVGGYLSIHSNAKLDALTSVGGGLSIYSNAKLDAPALYRKGFSSFKTIDGIGCVVLSSKKVGKVKILSCRHSKIKDGKIVGDRFYVARKDNVNAHGKTVSEAMQELAFKTEKRDVSQYKNMPMTTKKSPNEWALIYRAITGACKYGTDCFMGTKKLKKSYTLKQIIEETEGQYGHDRFVECVN